MTTSISTVRIFRAKENGFLAYFAEIGPHIGELSSSMFVQCENAPTFVHFVDRFQLIQI